MGIELYSQDSIFNAGVTAVKPITQLIDPIYDTDLSTKYYVDQTFAIYKSTPLSLPVATKFVLGAVRQGEGVVIERDGSISVADYAPMQATRNWILENGTGVVESTSWVQQQSANIVSLNEFNNVVNAISGVVTTPEYSSIQKIGSTLTRHATAIQRYETPSTWVENNSSSFAIQPSSTFIGKDNTQTVNGINNIVIGSRNHNNGWSNLVMLGNCIKPSGGHRVAIGSTEVPMSTALTATAGSATLPASPLGFILFEINGQEVKMPYYGV